MTLPSADNSQSLVAAIMERFGVPGAGFAIVSGDESAAWGYGVCEKGTPGTVTGETTFQLASCSKAYTATTAAILVDRGEIGWDDAVRKHLPEFQMHDERRSEIATLRDLLSMRLGYRSEGLINWGRNTELGVEAIFERLRYLEVIAGFRETFTYLNPAYTLMAEVIARHAGKPFAEFQQEALHKPLGQTNTFVCEGKFLPKRSHAFPHVTLENGVEPIGEARCGGRIGESCVYSTPRDAARWMRLHLAKGEIDGARLVSEAAMEEMHRSHVAGPPIPAIENRALGYAMGWQRRDMADGPLLVHEGGEFGVSTFTILDPLRRNGACVYANIVKSAAVRSATHALIDLLAGRKSMDWASIFDALATRERDTARGYAAAQFVDGQPTLDPQDLTGSYYSLANGVADIRLIPGGLDFCLRDGWVYDGELEPLGGNLYRSHPRFRGMRGMALQLDAKVQFRRDDQGIALHAPGFGTFRKLEVPSGFGT